MAHGTVAVEVDGVIHAYTRGWHDGTIYDDPVPGAFDALRTLMTDYAVYVHTTRNVSDVESWLCRMDGFVCVAEDLVGNLVTWRWRDKSATAPAAVLEVGAWPDEPVEFWNHPGRIEFWNDRDKILVSNRKLPALAYIDDRGIRFENWDQALTEFSRLYGRNA